MGKDDQNGLSSQVRKCTKVPVCTNTHTYVRVMVNGWALFGQYGLQWTSTLYANSSGPRMSTIRPTAAWSTPTVSLNPGLPEVDEVFLEVSLPVDDVGSGTRTLH